MSEWFDNAEIWKDISPLIFHQPNWEKARSDVEQGIALLQMTQNGAVLDIPCGPGRHALEFARQGFQVTAVDLMPFLLEHGRERARAESLEVEFIQDDMRSFVRPDSFDAVWNFFSSCGYFDDPQDDFRFLGNAFLSLRRGGKLLLEMSSRDHAVEFWKTRDRFEHPPVNGIVLIEEGRLSKDQSLVSLYWRIVKGEQTSEHRFALRLYSVSQMKSALRDIGFEHVEIYGDMAGNPYTPNCDRIVILAEKWNALRLRAYF
jgi:SAM-dependent methyltransferase